MTLEAKIAVFFDFENLTGIVKWGFFYPLMTLITILFFIGIIRLLRIWYKGRNPISIWRLPFVLLKRLLQIKRTKQILGSKILQRGKYAWIMHTSIMIGFIGLFVVTLILSIHEWVTPFLRGWYYVIWTIAGEISGFLFKGVMLGTSGDSIPYYELLPDNLYPPGLRSGAAHPAETHAKSCNI